MRPSVFDICVDYSQFDRSFHRAEHPQSRLRSRRSLIKSIYRHLKKTDKFNDHISRGCGGGKSIIFFGTKNQFNAFQNIDILNCIKIAPSFKNSNLPVSELYYLYWKEVLYSFLFCYRTIYDFIVEKDDFKNSSIWTGLASYFFASGSYQYWVSILKKINPSEVVISNDYNYHNRALIYAAKELGIKTVYIPHALIGIGFYTPPEMICDVVYVSGELENSRILKVLKNNKNCKIKHRPRFAFKNGSKKQNDTNAIGLSLNSIDNLESFVEDVERIKKQFPTHNIIVRPHPTMEMSLINSLGFEINKSTSLNDYFEKIDIHLAGSSMMHIDSILHSVPSFIFQYAISLDHYGFYEHGVINSVDDLIESKNTPKIFLANQQEKVKSLLFNSPSEL